jgi:hypothetical protein
MKQFYEHKKFHDASLRQINVINAIIDEYLADGYRLTVRQVYYQLVARGVIENSMQSYKKTTGLMNDARLAGLMDWDAIEDRTRSFIRRSKWGSPSEILQSAAASYHEDMWATQDTRVFCIVEKEALAGVLERVCSTLDIPLLAARGYPSGTVLREFTLSDLLPAIEAEQSIVILHLGDHDPSGIDMSRDLQDRIELFANGNPITLKRIALNMPQVEELNPPENPAKTTDSRFKAYRAQFGSSSWELDALPPKYMSELIESVVAEYVNTDAWEESAEVIRVAKERLYQMADEFVS